MNRLLSSLLCALGLTACLLAAPKSDILPSSARQKTLALADELSKPAKLEPLPTPLRPPFNPPGFDQPDPEELQARENTQANEPAKPKSEREVLATIAEKITPSGTIILSGNPILILNKKKFRVGDTLSVSFEGRDYDLEITAIDRSSFTLRMNRSEITRPIKAGKTP